MARRDASVGSLRRKISIVKTIDKRHLVSHTRQALEEFRRELRAGVSLEKLKCAWRLAALDQVLTASQLDSETFYRCWVQPLLAEGLSLKVAISRIIDSHVQPN